MKLANGGFLDATRWMDKVPPFASQRSVWHFHPLEFLEVINPKVNCSCGRDITLDELCDIAPKADKDVLAQYLPAFNIGFREFGIISCREKAHFLAQCCHESGGLTLTSEKVLTKALHIHSNRSNNITNKHLSLFDAHVVRVMINRPLRCGLFTQNVIVQTSGGSKMKCIMAETGRAQRWKVLCASWTGTYAGITRVGTKYH